MEDSYNDWSRIKEGATLSRSATSRPLGCRQDRRSMDWSVIGEHRIQLRLQILGYLWREFGRRVRVEAGMSRLEEAPHLRGIGSRSQVR